MKFYSLLSSVHSVESLIDVLVPIDDFRRLITDKFFSYDLKAFRYGISLFKVAFLEVDCFLLPVLIDLTLALLIYRVALVI